MFIATSPDRLYDKKYIDIAKYLKILERDSTEAFQEINTAWLDSLNYLDRQNFEQNYFDNILSDPDAVIIQWGYQQRGHLNETQFKTEILGQLWED